ncbi:bifunctional lysylphosphatidylglycerol flippase/synthetase MprF [Enterococcus ratti]|nr:bifunctional lysylphosphatidylglycerol flippase/synthetase MprF [Enterococcus ratti]
MKRIKLNFLKILFSIVIFLFSIIKISNELATIKISKVFQIIGNESIFKILLLFMTGALGIFILCCYDLVLIKPFKKIKIPKLKLLKISWIANSFNAVLGFGGIFGATVRYNFYKKYTKPAELSQLKKAISLLLVSTISGVGMLSIMVLLKVFPESNLLKENVPIKVGLIVSSCLFPLYIGYISFKPPIPSSRWLGAKFTIVSTIDYLTSGIVMYVAFRFLNLPVSFVDMESIFIIATIAGIISMVPGGFGAFDVIFLLGVTKELGIAKEGVLMALVLYRLAYYFIPLLIGLLLSVSEIQGLVSQKINNNQLTILSKELTTVVFSITQEQMKKIGRTLSTILFSCCSLAFLVDSCILFLEYAYMNDLFILFISPFYVCISVLLCTDIIGIYKGAKETYKVSCIKVLLLTLCQIYLLFIEQSLTAILLTVVMIINLLFLKKWLEVEVITQSILEKVLWVGAIFYVLKHLVEISALLSKQQFLLLGGSTLILLFLSGIWSFFHRKNLRKKMIVGLKPLKKEEYQSFLEQKGGNHLAHLGFLKENQVAVSNDVAIIFQESEHTLFILGDPLGDQEAVFPFLKNLLVQANCIGKRVIFYQASTRYLNFYNDLNYHFFKLGEEAVLDLDDFSLSGKKKRGFRATLNQMEKLGCTFHVIKPPYSSLLLSELKEVSDQWLDAKKEMTFSVGKFDKDYLNSASVGIIRDKEEKIVGFVSIMPTYTKETISVDLIRWRTDEDLAMMDALYLQIILWAKAQGYHKFNLGMAPFSSSYKNTSNLENTFTYSIYSNTQYLYSFKGLRKYKEKYKPKWSPKYIVYDNKTWVIKNLYDSYKLIHSK